MKSDLRVVSSIRRWFGRLRFKSKVITVFFPLLVVSLITLGILSSQAFSRSLIDRTTRNVTDQSELILSRTDYIFQSVETTANIMVTNINRLYESSPNRSDSTIEENRFSDMMQSRLMIDLSIFREADGAAFVEDSGRIYTSYPENEHERLQLSSDMIQQVRNANSYGTDHWFEMEKRAYLTPDQTSPVITLGKMVIHIDSGEPIGTLFLFVKEEKFSAFLHSVDPAAPKAYFFVDKNIQVAAATDKELLLQAVAEPLRTVLKQQSANSQARAFSYTEDGNLTTIAPYNRMGWQLVNVVSLKVLTSDVRQNVQLTVIVGLLCILFSWLGASVLSRVVVGPLEQLTRAMRKVFTGDINPVAEVRSEDEVGIIAESFNYMVHRVRELLDTVNHEQNRKREYELALINAQIKPHFLYNTLDTIYVLNEFGRNEEARDTTKALADFYRMVLNKGRELILLEKEVQLTDDYLSIMQIRYPDLFRYEIDIPSELNGAPIPKLSLQPLVENAIYHGLKNKETRGFIRISAFSIDDRIIVRVQDNGIGMDEAQINAILSRHSPEEETRSIGTYTVLQRMHLYFGENYGLSVSSTPGEGTIVDLSLPMLRKGSEGQDV